MSPRITEAMHIRLEEKQDLRDMSDRRLLIAVAILIGLVVWLIILSLNRSSDMAYALQQIQQLKTKVAPKDGIDGQNAVSTNTIIQTPIPGPPGMMGPQGAQGIPGPKGDTPALPRIITECVKGLISNRYEGDLQWQVSNIKCEVNHD